MKTLNKDLAAIQLNQVIEQLNEQTDIDSLVIIYNDYASDNKYERIHNLDESTINELYTSPWQALYDNNHKDFNDSDYFFTYNGNGHMVSFSNEDDSNCPIDISELAQWLVSEDKLADYDISVTTLDDMLASIEDNITDIDSVDNIIRLLNYLDIDYLSLTEWLTNDRNDIDSYIQNYIDFIIDVISNDMEYDTLVNLCDYFNVEYK